MIMRSNIIFIIFFILFTFFCFAEGIPEKDVIHSLKDEENVSPLHLIVPGEKVGLFNFNMTQEYILTSLGEPDQILYQDKIFSLEDIPDRSYFLYSTIGISFLINKRRIAEIITLSPDYRFANGIGVGSTQEEVINAFALDYKNIEYQNIEKGHKLYLIYSELGVTFEINKQSGIVWEINIRPINKVLSDTDFIRIMNIVIPTLNLATTTLDDLIRILGLPLAYSWGSVTYTRDNLPRFYILKYPLKINIFMHNEYIIEIEINTAAFMFSNGLHIGSSLEQVLEKLGPPLQTKHGQSSDFKDSILYLDIGGEEGACYYSREDKGIRFYFKNNMVRSIYLIPVK